MQIFWWELDTSTFCAAACQMAHRRNSISTISQHLIRVSRLMWIVIIKHKSVDIVVMGTLKPIQYSFWKDLNIYARLINLQELLLQFSKILSAIISFSFIPRKLFFSEKRGEVSSSSIKSWVCPWLQPSGTVQEPATVPYFNSPDPTH